jgi:hypothetical protein
MRIEPGNINLLSLSFFPASMNKVLHFLVLPGGKFARAILKVTASF